MLFRLGEIWDTTSDLLETKHTLYANCVHGLGDVSLIQAITSAVASRAPNADVLIVADWRFDVCGVSNYM